MESYSLLYLIPLLPLMGAAVLTLFGSRLERGLITVVALSTVAGAFVVTVVATWTSYRLAIGVDNLMLMPLENHLWSWIAVGRYRFDMALGLDSLSAVLMLVVTGVGFLIHLYSVGYMHDDPAYWRFFACLNFFIFAMSVLVLGRSLPVMFIGWEGVGLASYLLIGFWYSDTEKARAGKKAFITNRVGDFGFLVGIMILVSLFGTADFVELRRHALAITDPYVRLGTGIFEGLDIRTVVTIACLALFVGASGKSAQVPLYVWLPDAMAGPTPVSALIHAATMVTAGVYLVARLFFLFEMAPVAQLVVASVGAVTAVFAASIGLAQNDIKRVLAYSTVSQLGYMFLAAGLGAYGAAVFHLVTHAFFKACLFLGSGAVIHALGGEQDMRKMGGLRKRLPVVFWTFLLSTAALAGLFPFSGFFSKDAILAMAWQENRLLFWLGFLGAGLTAFYMTRLMWLTFGSELRLKDSNGDVVHVHRPTSPMKWPLRILAILAVFAGVLNLPHIVPHGLSLPIGWLDHLLQSSTGPTKALTMDGPTELALMGASTLWVLFWILLGTALYRRGPSEALTNMTRTGPMRWAHAFVYGKYFIDETYQAVLIGPLRLVSSFFSVIVDPYVIDGIVVKGTGYTILGAGKLLRRFQTGNVQSYAAILVISVAVIILWTLR